MEDTINWSPPATLYLYQADLYCPDCASAMQLAMRDHMDPDILLAVEDTGPDGPPMDWSSDHWPVEYSRGEGESDSPDHCGSCNRFLGRNLTPDGLEYIRESVVESLDRDGLISPVVQGWVDYYGIDLDSIDGYYGVDGICLASAVGIECDLEN